MAAAAREDDRPKLHSVAIELTAVCNQKCTYCYNEWRDDGGAELGAPSSALVLRRIDRLVEAFRIDHVTLTGGEPFSHREVFAILDRLREHGLRVQIISNGGLIDDALAARLAPYRPGYVQVTLNAPEAALHDEHVGGHGHYERTLRGIAALRAHGVTVVGCTVVTRKNAARVGEILAIWRQHGVQSIALARFSPAGYAAEATAELLPSRDDVVTALKQAQPYAQAGMSIFVTMPIPPCAVEVERFPEIQFGTCAVGTSMQELALGPDGKLRNCTLHKTAIGGVPDIADPSVDLRALLSAKEIVDYKKVVPAFCEGCAHASTCAGGCGAAAEWVLGDARAFPDPFLWQHVDDGFAATLEAARAGKRRLAVLG
jgi:radical SAM protein with 4Fe4S-binding SPASM domain